MKGNHGRTLVNRRSWIALAVLVVSGWRGAGAGAQDDAGGDSFGDPGQALIRVVHASPDAPALDLYVGEHIVASGLVAGDVTSFLPVPDGETGLRFVPAGGDPDTAIVETRFDLVDGAAYDVVALGQLREIDGRVYEIDRTRFESPEKSRVRFLHLSPDADEIDVFLSSDQPLFEGADFADATGYAEVDAGTYELRLGSSDPAMSTSGAPVTTAATSLDLVDGGVYDILAVGLTRDDTFGVLPLAATSDLPCGRLLGAGGAGDACIRVVHASVDTPPFDLFLDDSETPLVAGLGFATDSGFVPVPAGTHQIRLTVAGDGKGEVLRETKIELGAGTAYDLAALDLKEQLDVRTIGLDLSPLGAGQARLRFVHAMPNQSGLTLGLTGGEVMVADVQFPDVSAAFELPAAPLDLEIRTASDEATVLAAEPGFDLAAGRVYVLYVIGTGDGAVAQVLTLTTPAATASGAPPPSVDA